MRLGSEEFVHDFMRMGLPGVDNVVCVIGFGGNLLSLAVVDRSWVYCFRAELVVSLVLRT